MRDFVILVFQVINLIKPIASVKRLQLNLILAPDLPVFAIGDEKRLMQTILNITGNAVKFTREGYISIIASVEKPEALRELRPAEFEPASSDGHFFLRVQAWHLLLIANLYESISFGRALF